MERITLWLSERERTMVRELAKANDCSQNYIIRRALREALGIKKEKVEAQTK